MSQFIPSTESFTGKIVSSVMSALQIMKNQKQTRRPIERRSRALQLEQLEVRAVFATGAGAFILPEGPSNLVSLPKEYSNFAPDSIYTSDFAHLLKSFDQELKSLKPIFAALKLSAKPPKLSKESLELLKSNPAISQWQALSPAQRFEKEAVHAAHQVIAELLPGKSSLSREEFVSNVLSGTLRVFTNEGDNSLSKDERFAYLKGARGMAALVLSDGQKNQEMAKYLSRRFGDFEGKVQSLAEDAYRSSTFELKGKFHAKPTTTGMSNLQDKFNTAANYAADRAILDLRDQQGKLTNTEFVAGAISLARIRYMNDAGSFLTPSEASAYLKAMGKGGQSALVDYYSKRFDRDHLEIATSSVLQAASEMSFKEEDASSTSVTSVTTTPPNSPTPPNPPTSNGTSSNAAVVPEVNFSLDVTQRLEQRASQATVESIQDIRREGKTSSEREFVAEVLRRARTVFATTAHFSLTLAERRTYEKAIRSSSAAALQNYFAYRFDNQYVTFVQRIARDAFKD